MYELLIIEWHNKLQTQIYFSPLAQKGNSVYSICYCSSKISAFHSYFPICRRHRRLTLYGSFDDKI